MFIYQIEWVSAFVYTYVFFSMGKYEARAGDRKDYAWLWAACSFALSAIAIRLFQASYTAILLLQVALYFAIALVATLIADRHR